MGFINKLISIFKPKKKVHISLNPDSVRDHNIIKAVANENAELKGEIAKLKKELGELRESKKDIKEEEEVRIELNEKKKQLEAKSYPKYFSLKSFFNKVRNNKFSNSLYFYSFDGSEKISRFGDIGISSSGDFVLLNDKREVITYAKRLQDLFWSVGGLEVDVMAKKIPLCMDKNGNYIENVMITEMPELIPIKGGKFKYSKARKKPFYEHIKDLMSQISEQHEEIEQLELTNTELQKENDDLKVSQRVAEDSAETARSDLAQAEQSTSAIGRIFRGTERELSQLRDTNVILEDNIEKLENQVEILRDEAEREGTKLNFDKALEQIQNIKRDLVKDMPDRQVEIVERVVEKPVQQPPK